MQSQRRGGGGRQSQSQPEPQPQPRQYYTAITEFPDPNRLVKLLELGSPSLFDGGRSTSNFSFAKSEVPKLKLNSASITITTKSDDRLSKLLGLGDVNFFGGSPTAEVLAARKR
jgi:hypothetical protein